MKLNELKQKVYTAWEFLSGYRGCIIQPENFKLEVRQFGDLRRKDTWIKALARFEALNASHDCLDAYNLILQTFNFTPNRWDYEFRYVIFDEFLMIPGGLELIQLGLEQLLSTLPKEAQKAYIASEIRATHELNQSECYSCGPDQRDDEIVETVRESAKQTRKWLPWECLVKRS